MKKICQLGDIEDGQARSFAIPDKPERTLLVVRRGQQAWAYLNMCPHMGVELEFSPDKFISFDGTQIQCAMHGALFEFTTGYCSWGPCQGRSLVKVNIHIKDGAVFYLLGAEENEI